MSGFYSNGENFDRIFITDHEIVENFIGTRAFAFGYNATGGLGDNSATSRLSPVDLSGVGNNWRQLSAGGTVSAAVKMDGTLWTWGVATYGVLGNGSTTASRSSPGTTTLAGTDWKEVSIANYIGTGASSGRFCAAIKLDGTLWTWGFNGSGQLGSGNTTNRSSPVSVNAATDWLHVACGSDHALAVTASGQIYSWGLNSSGQLGDGSTTLSRTSPGTIVGNTYDWIKVAAGGSTTAAIKNEGSLWCWGSNTLGVLGDSSTSNKSSPVSVAGGGFNWEKASVGSSGGHCVATKTDGTLWTWGSNSLGQLGTGATSASRSSPGTVDGGGTNWKDCSAGSNHSVAVKVDGILWTWGGNAAGQLGDGSTTAKSSPATTATNGVYEWQKVAAGGGVGGYTLASAVFIG